MTSHRPIKQEGHSSSSHSPPPTTATNRKPRPLINLHYITYNELSNSRYQSTNIDCTAVSQTPVIDVPYLWQHLNLLTTDSTTKPSHLQPSPHRSRRHNNLPLEYNSIHHVHSMMKKLALLGSTNKYVRQRTPAGDDLLDDDGMTGSGSIPSNQSLAASSRTMSVPTSLRSHSTSSHQRQLQYMRDVSDEDLAVKRLHLLHEHPSPSRNKRQRSVTPSTNTTPRHSVTTTIDHSANQRIMEASLANHNDALNVLTQIALTHSTAAAADNAK